MPRHGTLRGVGLTALGAVVVEGSFVALGLRPDGIASFYRDTLTPAGFAIWFCGLVAATLAPPAIAFLCRFGAMRFRHGWLLPSWEELRVGKECVSRWSTRWSPSP